METFYRVDVNIVSMIILMAFLVIANHKLERKNRQNRIFIIASLVVASELLIEAASCFTNGMPGKSAIFLSNLFAILLFVIAPLLTFTFLLFLLSMFFPNRKLSKNIIVLLLVPIAITSIMALLSPIFGWVYYIDDLGVYHRGNLFLVQSFFTYIYLIIGLIAVIINRKYLMKLDYRLYIIIAVIPVVGGIIQSLFYGVLLMWSSAAFALVFAYLLLHDRMVHVDALSGAWTRESFVYHLERRLTHNPNDRFGAIYLDIDGLKNINDQFGHSEGDKAIQSAISLIRTKLSSHDIISRIGGDEFIILIECTEVDSLYKRLELIKSAFQDSLSTNQWPYKLECSFGADFYDNRFSSLDIFIHHIDHLMYEDKNQKKHLVKE